MKKVLIIGGGYGGLRAIETLAKDDNIDITLIDKNPYHYLQTEAYGYIAGKFDIHDIAIDLKSWCAGFKNVKYIQQEIKDIDTKNRSIKINDKEEFYHYIILAVGARTNFFSFIDGLREHSYGVKDLNRTFDFRKEFESIIYKKLKDTDSTNTDTLNIAIGGAGLSGVEVAAEMAHTINSYSKTIGQNAKKIKIYLIDASATILPGSSDYIINNTYTRLEKLGVNILTNAFISKVEKSKIFLKNGDTIDYKFMIFTGGIKASSLNNSIECEKNSINQFIANKNLNIGENIFAVGDCVEIRDNKNNLLPPTAQTAERSAEYVASVIKNDINGLGSKDFTSDMMGMFIALGGNYAVGEVFKVIKIKGYPAYLMKKAITYAYYIGLRLRINTGFKNRIKHQD